ncbi:amidoligase family protein [Acetivibrio straminisolvens]|mgnify:CR=1 FL=1|uniref:amidoligase family protein n=1 Tax=Acetivibrio straminisolvens TaxID=253314 RepID=UPI00223F7ABE|nr:amidoligase family protein [Acetivibrio straminisolvens]HOV25738.1 virulence-related protein [Pseudobacteroides sp.]
MNQNTFIYSTGISGMSRKETAGIIAAHFGTEVSYKGAPSFEYTATNGEGREWRITKDGTVITPELMMENLDGALEVFKALAEAGVGADGCAASVVLPIAGHNGITLRNLLNVIASKQALIFKALNVEDRFALRQEFVEHINQIRLKTAGDFLESMASCGGDEASPGIAFTKDSISFRWFSGTLEPEHIKAYIQFVQAINAMALAQKHSTPRATKGENEKYIFRVWLLRLGFIGDKYKAARKLFLDRLDGNRAFRTEEAMREAMEKRKGRVRENVENCEKTA